MSFVAIKMGRRQGAKEGAYPERYVTDEQRSRRPIFIATLWAAASWLFFRVARSSRIDLEMLVARALKNSQLTPRPRGERHAYFGDRTPMPWALLFVRRKTATDLRQKTCYFEDSRQRERLPKN